MLYINFIIIINYPFIRNNPKTATAGRSYKQQLFKKSYSKKLVVKTDSNHFCFVINYFCFVDQKFI